MSMNALMKMIVLCSQSDSARIWGGSREAETDISIWFEEGSPRHPKGSVSMRGGVHYGSIRYGLPHLCSEFHQNFQLLLL